MPSYDALHFHPPAPVAGVTLRNLLTGASVSDVQLLVDTGADITLLPRASVEQIGVTLSADQRYELISFDGSRSFAPVVTLDMVFLGRAYRGRYVLADEQRGILGRDVLNLVTLLLDGPQQEWAEQPP